MTPLKSTTQPLSVISCCFEVIHSHDRYQNGFCLFTIDLFRGGSPANAMRAGTLHSSPTHLQKLGLFLVPGKHFLTISWGKKEPFSKTLAGLSFPLMCPWSPVPQLEVHLWVPVRATPSPGTPWLTSTTPLSSLPGQSGQDILLPGGSSLGPLILLGRVFDLCSSLMAQLVKNLPAVWAIWVRSLGWEDPLEKEKATHSSILAWRTPQTVQSTGSQRVGHN